ncbi:hypothetical protein J2Z42_002558 [Clostridium algifaecis]|uniref:F5/8 type C domain-containing protein n=1 Tax=Clostridium algifaecis TaxID=1472040 RepID=A0ABS4KWG4_9CLOT|nr:DUF4434 domain-containing protein [Clostridium algifaecis]MBP2033851.1 hypothetical protein [Clostridium algifaecis]
MKNKKYMLYSAAVLIFIFAIFIYYKSPIKRNKDYPILAGSFIQIDLTQNWNENKWMKELEYYKKNNMEYVVLTGITSTENNITKTAYKSNIYGFQKIYGNTDQVNSCLESAEKLGIKVFLSSDFNSGWWKESPDDKNLLKDDMKRTNLICDELYKKYKVKYPNSFYGWYFPYEVDNIKFNKKNQFYNLAEAINVNLNYLELKKERLPFLISPFMNSSVGTSMEYADNWKYFFSKVNFKQNDIFCPQDSVGGGGLDINQVNPWFTSLKKAVDSKKGLKLWANAESFDYVNNSSATLDRFIKQLQLEQPCVDEIISFSYSHYYSPNNIDPGFNEAYFEYVKSGELIHNKVNKPKNLNVQSIGKDEFKLTWDRPDRYKNICGYRIYRNGVLIFESVVPRKYGGEDKQLYLSVKDKPILKENVDYYTYEVKAIDFSGNMSDSSNKVRVNVDGIKVFPKLLSKGCKYTFTPRADNYSDSSLSKLTDGNFASKNSVKDDQFSKWYNNSFDLEIDLKKTEQIRQFMIDYYREPKAWAALPKAASIAVSEDGINFIPIGLVRIPFVPFSDRNGSRYPIYFTLDKPIYARYVKLTSITEPNYSTFIDEFEVRN